MSTDGTGRGISSVESALRVLEAVAVNQPVGVSALARTLGIPKSSVQRYLVALHEAGWLQVVSSTRGQQWGIGTRPVAVGLRAAGEDTIRTVAQPHLETLCARTGETVHLAIPDRDALVVVSRVDCTQPVRTYIEIGTKAPLHATSSGLSVLASLQADEIDRLLGVELERFSDQTLVERNQLLAEIELVRRRGYAWNPTSWWRPQVSAVGAAVVDRERRPVAAIAVSIPTSRVDVGLIPGIGAAAVDTARLIAADLAGGDGIGPAQL